VATSMAPEELRPEPQDFTADKQIAPRNRCPAASSVAATRQHNRSIPWRLCLI